MESKYIHLIAFIMAVFFTGLYLRGESAHKQEIKRELALIEMRRDSINSIIAEINQLAVQKDSLLRMLIDSSRSEIARLTSGDSLVRDSIDALGDAIRATDIQLNLLAARINRVPGLILEELDLHSAFDDPDASLIQASSFADIPTHQGRSFFAPIDTADVAIEIAPAIPAHLRIALQFADDPTTPEIEGGVVEDPGNRSPNIDRWLSAVLAEPFRPDGTGLPYCAAYVSFCLTEAGNIDRPRTRSAGSRQFVKDYSFKADMCAESLKLNREECDSPVESRVVLRGTKQVEAGTLVIWKRKRDPVDVQGHIGIVREWEGHKGLTVEGNTSPGNFGSQRDGEGVYLRERELKIGSWFRITHFTPVTLDDDA